MIKLTWKQRFFVLLGTAIIFIGGLSIGIVLTRPSGTQSAAEITNTSGPQYGDTRLDRPAEPLPDEADGSFNTVANQVLPVVIEVSVVAVVEQEGPQDMFEFFFGPRGEQQPREYERPGIGSGVIVRRSNGDVYALTNYHVVGQADEIEVGLYDGRTFEAELVGGDERSDLALLRFNASGDIPVADLGNSDNLQVGDWVLAVGNPFGFHSSVTAGIVSATGRRAQQGGARLPQMTDFIQTDAAINPGNSGGALVNMQGEVIGINTWIVGSQGGGNVGLGFAIPINHAAGAIDQLIEEGRIVYGWLGVSIADASQESLPTLAEDLGILEEDGSLIVNVYRDSPAAQAGIMPGDYVTAIGDQQIDDTVNFQRVVGGIQPGESRDFHIIRNGEEQTVSVTLTERGPEEDLGEPGDLWPGVTAIPLDDEIRADTGIDDSVTGVIAAVVQPDSPAATAGVRPGDVITEANGNTIGDAGDFYRTVADAGADGQDLELVMRRQEARITIQLPGL